jgi:adenine-specific DNA-methyltransferase
VPTVAGSAIRGSAPGSFARVIKYLGSKRRLVPVLGEIASAVGAATALDLFTGTTRVAQELKRRSVHVTAVDLARYSEVFARCYIATDASTIDQAELSAALAELDALPGQPGYVTKTFCTDARFFQPHNGARIDAIRNAIAERFASSRLEPLLLTSLIEAADRVDSTTGVQMAFVKQWATRSYQSLRLRELDLLDGGGAAVRGDALVEAGALGPFDLAYLDPPYNQHRYFTNYHIWETLVAWDAPEYYGVACKRVDARDDSTRSPFNQRRAMPVAMARVVADVRAELLVISYNNESWLSLDELCAMTAARCEDVAVLAFDSRRYVGAQIGIFSPAGQKVGRVSHLHNVEYLVIGGPRAMVAEAMAAGRAAHPLVRQ